MICPHCQDSGVVTLYLEGLPIRRPCRCLTHRRSLDRIQLTRRPGHPPLPAQLHKAFAEVKASEHEAISLLVVAAILTRPVRLGSFHIAAPTSGLNLF